MKTSLRFAAYLLLFILFLEFSLKLFFTVRDRRYRDPIDQMAFADVYDGIPWAKEYSEEFKKSFVVSWHPYVYFRRKPFEGKYINVDASGVRKTWTALETKEGAPFRIFVFGGSAAWGTGARDEFSIPSFLAKELSKLGHSVQVTNFAELGYVSTQEMTALFLELRGGNVPDLAIFYDGYNDALSAFRHQSAGLPQNEENRHFEFNASKRYGWFFLQNLWRNSAIARAMQACARKSGFDQPETLSLDKEAALAEEVVKNYEKTYRLIKAAGSEFGFSALFYWQANLVFKTQLSNSEKEKSAEISEWTPFFRKISEELKSSAVLGRGDFRDFSGVFQTEKGPVFIDSVHVSESGNEFIARQMLDDVVKRIHEKNPAVKGS